MYSLWSRIDQRICAWFLPLGLAVLLSGFFWVPSSHSYKVIVNYCLLLPCLLATLAWPKWRDYLTKTSVLSLAIAYLVYMSLLSIVLTGVDGLDFLKWSALILLFLIGVGLRMQIPAAGVAKLLLACSAVAAVAGIYAIFRDVESGIFLTYQYRLQGYATLYNAFRSGLLFGAFSAIALWCLFEPASRPWQRYSAGAVALVCLCTLVLTGSRAPLLALVIVGVLIAISYRRWWYIALILIGAVSVIAILWDQLFDRGASFRPEIWGKVWQACMESPLLGVGLQQVPIKVMTSSGVAYNEHNLLLALWRQGGVMGVLLYLALAFVTCVQGWRSRKASRIGFLAAILQIYSLVALQFDGVRLITRPADAWVLFWLPVALLMFSQRVEPACSRSQA